MRLGTLISLPNEYSHYGRILDNSGTGYTVELGDLPEDAQEGEQYAYKLELWGNESGLASSLSEED